MHVLDLGFYQQGVVAIHYMHEGEGGGEGTGMYVPKIKKKKKKAGVLIRRVTYYPGWLLASRLLFRAATSRDIE